MNLVVDPVGGEAFDDAIRALATEGRLLVIGFAAGRIPTVKVNRLLMRNVGVLGVGWGEYFLTASRRWSSCSAMASANWSRRAQTSTAGSLSAVESPLRRCSCSADGGVFGKLVLEP